MPETKIYPNTLKKHEREQHRAAIERSTRFDHIPHERMSRREREAIRDSIYDAIAEKVSMGPVVADLSGRSLQ